MKNRKIIVLGAPPTPGLVGPATSTIRIRNELARLTLGP